jgi:hypothetical protein
MVPPYPFLSFKGIFLLLTNLHHKLFYFFYKIISIKLQ